MLVMKFGGTSVGSAKRIKDVADIVSARGRNLVVLSAMSGTTDTLVEISGYLYNNNPAGAREIISRLRVRYAEVIEELYDKREFRNEAISYVNGVLDDIEIFCGHPFTKIEEKIILSKGELMSSYMMTCLLRERGLNVALLPALEFMRTGNGGEPDINYISSHLNPLISAHPEADLFITQGYICTNKDSQTDNLQRGGSDYTASLVGAAIMAEEIQIWTDIDGMHNNDPRIVDHTSPVRHLNFEEAAELGFFGAKILHPTCIQPAKYANIRVRLLNTLDPTAPGTLIDNEIDTGSIKAVAAKDNITAIKIKSSRMLLAYGFMRKVFEIFETYHTSIDMICTSEVGVTMTLDNTDHIKEIVHDLKRYGTVTVDTEMCIICVVGDMDWENVGFESKASQALKDIPVRMISFGGSNYNISFLIRQSDKKRALQALSDNLFNNVER